MLRTLEISWLIIVIVGIVLGLYKVFIQEYSTSIWIFVITGIAAVIYTIRRKQRIAFDRERESRSSDES